MFKRDTETGEEIAHLVTTPAGYTAITLHPDFHKQAGDDVQEVRGHTGPNGFVIDRTVN